MRRLLKADLVQLLRNKVFWAILATMIIGTIALDLSFRNAFQSHGSVATDWTAEGAIFCMMPGIGMLNALWIHFCIGSDFDQGTIRNKLICGHHRSSIFFSHWLVACAGALANLAITLLIGTVLSKMFFQDFALDRSGLCWLYLCCALLTVAYTVIGVALAINISSKAGSIVTGMLVITGLSVLSSFIDSKITDIEIRGIDVGPLNEKILYFFHDFLPSGQCTQINNLLFDRMAIWPLYSLILTVLVTAVGYLLFRKKDIK